MGWFCLLLFPLTALPTLLGVPDSRATTQMTVNWLEAMKVIATNRTLWRLLVADLASGFGMSVSGALYIFTATYVLNLGDQASLALLFFFLASFLAMPAWLRIAYRIGKDATLRVALMIGVLVVLAFLFLAAIMLWIR